MPGHVTTVQCSLHSPPFDVVGAGSGSYLKVQSFATMQWKQIIIEEFEYDYFPRRKRSLAVTPVVTVEVDRKAMLATRDDCKVTVIISSG